MFGTIVQIANWDTIIQAVSLLASMASLVLAIVAIWLSFKFYDMSIRSSEKIEESNRAIGASVDKLEKLFQTQYSDTFSMVRDTYSDFRKRLLEASFANERTEQVVEGKADEKLKQLRNEVQSELTSMIERIGQTDAQVASVREHVEEVVNRALTKSREVEKEARDETLQDAILSFLSNQPKKESSAFDIWRSFKDKFDGGLILQAILGLNKEGKIKTDRSISRVSDIDAGYLFSLVE